MGARTYCSSAHTNFYFIIMKTVTMTVKFRVSDEFYQEEMLEMKNDIQSGKFQRDMMDNTSKREKGLKWVKADFKVED